MRVKFRRQGVWHPCEVPDENRYMVKIPCRGTVESIMAVGVEEGDVLPEGDRWCERPACREVRSNVDVR